ncbi:MAG TPA: hypothetical protein VGS58_13825, partial [Candidatus Sulfopaludibacter sp.]|nr:hypothetical protein [Candidatus Sulfopaludibacter sp.]
MAAQSAVRVTVLRRAIPYLPAIGGLLLLAGPLLRAGDDPKEIVRRALQLNSRNQEAQRNYTYLEREEQRTLDGSGAV